MGPKEDKPLHDHFDAGNFWPMESKGDSMKIEKQIKQEGEASGSRNDKQETKWPFRNAAAAEDIPTASFGKKKGTKGSKKGYIILPCVTCGLLWVMRFPLRKEHPIMSSCSNKNAGASTICPTCEIEPCLVISKLKGHFSDQFKAITISWSSLFDAGKK